MAGYLVDPKTFGEGLVADGEWHVSLLLALQQYCRWDTTPCIRQDTNIRIPLTVCTRRYVTTGESLTLASIE